MAQILIIDDEAAVRRVMRVALERAGHSVIEAGDGAEGMRLRREKQPELIITDLFMPGQDGIETIQQLREEDAACRIIAVSGGVVTDAEGPLTDARLFGADATLAKPFRIEDLVAAVARVLAAGA